MKLHIVIHLRLVLIKCKELCAHLYCHNLLTKAFKQNIFIASTKIDCSVRVLDLMQNFNAFTNKENYGTLLKVMMQANNLLLGNLC